MRLDKKQSALLILIFVAAAIYLFYSYKNRPITLSYNPSPESVLIDLQNELGTITELSEDRGRWMDKDSKFTALKGHEFWIGSPDNPHGKYKPLSAITINELTKKINAFFSDKNFRKELENEFEKDEIYCVVSYRGDSDPYASVFCGGLDHEATRLREEFSPIVNPKGDPSMNVYVSKVTDDFAVGGVTGETSGYFWIAKKTADKWNLIFEGHQLNCEIIRKYGIPKDIGKEFDSTEYVC